MKLDFALGGQVRNGSKKSRMDALGKCAVNAFKDLKKQLKRIPTNLEVIDYMGTRIDSEGIEYPVQEVDKDSKNIFWVNRRGAEQKTQFDTFYNRMSGIRKKYTS